MRGLCIAIPQIGLKDLGMRIGKIGILFLIDSYHLASSSYASLLRSIKHLVKLRFYMKSSNNTTVFLLDYLYYSIYEIDRLLTIIIPFFCNEPSYTISRFSKYPVSFIRL